MFLIAALVLIASVSANSCPDINTVDNFQFNSFGQGIWYEVARYNHPAEDGSVCGHAEYTLVGDEIKVKNYFVRNNRAFTIDGTARKAPSAGKSGKVLFQYPYGPGRSMSDSIFNILAIDYDNYCIGYYCKYDKDSQRQQGFAWILSRTKVLSAEAKAAVDKFISESKLLDSKKFIWPEFTEEACRVIS